MKQTDPNIEGFTIIELLVVIVLSLIAIAGIFTTFNFQQRSYELQRQMVAMEQNLRAAMHLMSREIRMAGCDPNDTADAGILTANSGTIRFTMDINNNTNGYRYDGDTDDTNEDVSYTTQTIGGIPWLMRSDDGGGSWQRVAENISNLQFQYLNETGGTTGVPADVRSVVVTVQGQTASVSPVRNLTLSSQIKCRNLGL